jgi:hypothetical protein
MAKIMTITEIESQYGAEWILVEDPETDDDLQVQGGKVVAHSKDRDEVYRHAVAARPKRFAVIYTGSIPKDTAIVL